MMSKTTTKLYQSIPAQQDTMHQLLAGWEGPKRLTESMTQARRELIAGEGRCQKLESLFTLRIVTVLLCP